MHVRTLVFFRYFSTFFIRYFSTFFLKLLITKKYQYSCYGAFVPSLCIPHGRNKVSEKFCRSTILVNFWKNLHVRTLVFFRYFSTFFIRYFSTFFLNLLITKKCRYSCYGAFVPSLCIPHGRNKVSKKICRSTILVNFWKNLHVRTLVFHLWDRCMVMKCMYGSTALMPGGLRIPITLD